jgi:acetyl esterase/lipase
LGSRTSQLAQGFNNVEPHQKRPEIVVLFFVKLNRSYFLTRSLTKSPSKFLVYITISLRITLALLLHGGRDELVSSYQSSRLTERLAEAGVPHLNVRLPWATHGFDFIFRGPGGQISTYAVEYFLARVTSGTS